MKKREKTLLEILLDSNDHSNIITVDETGGIVKLEQVAVIMHDKKLYFILHPIETEGIAEDESVVFTCENENALKVVEDQAIAVAVFDKYYELLENTIKEKIDSRRNKK